MIITKKALSRRTILRGIGTTLALPLLDAMTPALTAASKTATPRRFGAIMTPVGQNIYVSPPKGFGTDFQLSPIMKSLEPFRDQLVIPTGLAQKGAESMGDGNGEHARAQAAFLTSAHPKWTEGPDVRAGITIDQVVAEVFGKETPLPSLELGLENSAVIGNCDNGYSCVYVNALSWRTPTTPLPSEHNPRVLFERLFGEGGTATQRVARMKEDRSILDAVVQEITRLERSLGVGDRARVDQYIDAVREIERRIQRAEVQAGESVLPPTLERPVGVPESFDEHAKLMYDLQAMAFQTDTTRVFSLIVGREQTGKVYSEVGVTEGHHAISHHGQDSKKLDDYVKVGTFHYGHFAYFLDKLRSMPDGDGNLLDHSLLLFGSGISDGDQHSHIDLPLVVAGGLTGVKKGLRVHHKPYTPMANLFLTLLDKLGIEGVEKFGDSTGRVDFSTPSTV